MKNFIWKTKGQTLLWLATLVNESNIPNLIVFKLEEWLEDPDKILRDIQKNFHLKKVAIRSSSFAEDTLTSSNAGAFESFLNINTDSHKILTQTINKVFSSYKKLKNKMDEVIIQEMVDNISVSGVIFTHEIKNGAPYYSINYDDTSGSSTTVTSGSSRHSNKTLYVHRKSLKSVKSHRFSKLLISILELEKFFNSDKLDIEFIITNHLDVKILQVRPIASLRSFNIKNNLFITKEVNKLKNNLKKNIFLNKSTSNIMPIFGQMPDWNPVEMLGVVPRSLAFSLYKALITDEVWCSAREEMDYSKSKDRSLMLSFSGHPYINVKSSFFSFIPKELDKKIAKKLVRYWLESLKKSPELHDKIEFDIAITTFSFDIQERIDSLPEDIFSKKDKISIRKAFYNHFIKLMNPRSPGSLISSKKKMLLMETKLAELQKERNVSIVKLIDLCIKYGTIPFSKLARHAFIGTTIMKSLYKIGLIKYEVIADFSSSINTVLSEMLLDINKLKNNSLKLSSFKKKYGHLRPGTYDITSKSYRDIDPVELFGDRKISYKNNKFKLTNKDLNKINQILKKYKLPFKDAYCLLDYIKETIQAREVSKFQFTKIIDAIFKNIKAISKKLSITTKDLSFLPINMISSAEEKNSLAVKAKLVKEIKKRKDQHKIFTSIKLPQLIMDYNHAVVIPFQVSTPNFITNKIIEAEISYINNYEKEINLFNKIVLIESADPGYDWLFTTKFKGLVTKYGGANSHMAIRCAELSIPAAIGCGEQLFEHIKKFKKIYLNCSSSIINSI